MPTTKITLTKGTETRTHVMDFEGISGAILWTLLGCLFLFTFSFATTYWYKESKDLFDTSAGLWTICSLETSISGPSWMRATQAMACIGLIFLILAVCLAFVYLMFHKIDKNYVLYGLTGSSCAAGLFLFLTIVIYGAEMGGSGLHISYAFAVISTILALGAGGLAILQIRTTTTAHAQPDAPQY